MRADSLRQTDTLQRLQDKLADAERKVALAEADETALRAQLKTAETTIHKLKEEAARTKKSVIETRAACANEVRKRDRQIEGLKKAASEAGRARGERKSAAITTIHVAGEIGGDQAAASAPSTMAEDYDLRQETNGFLAQLAKSLSEENETLLSLIRKTNHSLKQMSGWDKTEEAASAGKNSDNHALNINTNPEDLATDVESVLDHLRTMLTNPSFVPLEEVVVREEEIFRLRHGWERMEERWREAVHLIDGWRQRMAANGQPVDMEDLKMGLRLSPVRVQNVEETEHNRIFDLSTLQEEDEEEEQEEEKAEEDDEEQQEEEIDDRFEQRPESPSPPASLHLVPAPGYEDMASGYDEARDDLDHSDAESSIFHDDVDIDMEELQEAEPNVEILQYSTTDQVEVEAASDASDSVSLPQPPRITPLEEIPSAANRTAMQRVSRKRSGDYIDQDDVASKPPPPPPHRIDPEQFPQKRLKVSTDGQNEEPRRRPNSDIFTESNSSLDSILLLKPSPESSVSTAPSATARSTRSETATKKEATVSAAKPATKRTRAVAQEKKDNPSRPLPRQRPTRATAATASSSARALPSQPGTASKPRPAPNSSNTTDMPPPPRPSRSDNHSPALQGTPAAATRSRKSATERNSAPVQPQPTPAPRATSRSGAKPVAESPAIKSPGKSASRLPMPRNAGVLPPPQQSPLSMARIAAKLAASEREADAARVRAKLKAARLGKANQAASSASAADTTSLAPAQTSTASKAPSRVASHGDPAKRSRQDSGMSGSLSLDENGQTGGVSISRVDSNASAVVSSSSLGRQSKYEESSDENKTIAPLSPRRQRVRKEEKEAEAEAAPIPPPRKVSGASPIKTSAAPAAAPVPEEKALRKREPRSRADKVASRRRSTLSPWELQSLIAGEVVPPTPRVPEEHLQATG